MNKPAFGFGNVVMVDDGLVGVVIKSWGGSGSYNHDVYVRSFNGIRNYRESEMRHFIYDKELTQESLGYYK